MSFTQNLQSKFYPVLKGLSVKSPIPSKEYKSIVSHETLKRSDRNEKIK